MATRDIAQQRLPHGHTPHSHTVSSSLGRTHRPLCSAGIPKVLPSAPPPAPHPLLLLPAGQDRGLLAEGPAQGTGTGTCSQRGSPARREASEKGLPRQQAPAEPTRGFDSQLLFLEVGAWTGCPRAQMPTGTPRGVGGHCPTLGFFQRAPPSPRSRPRKGRGFPLSSH